MMLQKRKSSIGQSREGQNGPRHRSSSQVLQPSFSLPLFITKMNLGALGMNLDSLVGTNLIGEMNLFLSHCFTIVFQSSLKLIQVSHTFKLEVLFVLTNSSTKALVLYGSYRSDRMIGTYSTTYKTTRIMRNATSNENQQSDAQDVSYGRT
jgi:hypothetical protein